MSIAMVNGDHARILIPRRVTILANSGLDSALVVNSGCRNRVFAVAGGVRVEMSV